LVTFRIGFGSGAIVTGGTIGGTAMGIGCGIHGGGGALVLLLAGLK
jgi:hypothetical protein